MINFKLELEEPIESSNHEDQVPAKRLIRNFAPCICIPKRLQHGYTIGYYPLSFGRTSARR